MKPDAKSAFLPEGANAEELAAIISHSPLEFYIIRRETLTYLHVNETACANTGYTHEAFLHLNVFDLNPEMTQAHVEMLRRSVNREEATFNNSVHRRRDGSTYHVHSHIYEMPYRGEPVYIVFCTDVSEQRRLEQVAAERGVIIDKATNEIYILDYETNRYLYANQGACQALGYTFDELLRMNVFDVNPDLKMEDTLTLKAAAQGRAFITNTSRHRRRDGSTYPVHAVIQHIRYQGHDAYMIIDTDITEIEAAREALKQQAHYDQLTGLPNRILFNDRLEHALDKTMRRGGKTAVLFIDYDHFKQVNDTFGHGIGDGVLHALAERLRRHVRRSDTLARMSGDEFLVLMEDIGQVEEALELIRRIAEGEMQPVIVGDQEFHLTCSIGCAFAPMDGEDAETLIRHADMAMYHAKQTGRNRYRCYSHVLGEEADAKMSLLSELRRAQERGEFFLRYQPQVALDGPRPVGLEALVRWHHPGGDVVNASEFINVAARSGILSNLGKSVMEMAMRQMHEWDRDAVPYGRVSVNLSMLQLADPELPRQIAELMRRFEVRPERLEFEITESEIMHNPEQTVKALREISDLGISLAVDDFGTGHASLAYLKRFPIDRLKIDRDFIAPLPHNSDDASIVQMIAALGDALRLEVVAEGVETEEQLAFVKKAGCGIVQGFYYSEAIDADKVGLFLERFTRNR